MESLIISVAAGLIALASGCLAYNLLIIFVGMINVAIRAFVGASSEISFQNNFWLITLSVTVIVFCSLFLKLRV